MKGYRSKTEIASIINESRAVEFHINPSQVANDIEAMKKRFLDKGIEDYTAYRNQLLEELNLLKKTYWEGYQLSRRNKITIESEAILDNDEYDKDLTEGLGLRPNENVFIRQAKTKEEQRLEGNVAYLQGVLSVIDREAKMIGVDAPSKVALTDPSGKNSSTNVFDFMKERLDELAQRNIDEPKQLESMNKNPIEVIQEVEEDTTEDLTYE